MIYFWDELDEYFQSTQAGEKVPKPGKEHPIPKSDVVSADWVLLKITDGSFRIGLVRWKSW